MTEQTQFPAVSPDVRQWLLAQAQGGHGVQAILKAMLAVGWREDMALNAIEATLHVSLAGTRPKQAVLPPSVVVPVPPLQDSPLYLELGDRQVHVLSVLKQPHVVVFGGFLGDDECAALIEAAKPAMARSLTVDTKTGGSELNAARTSSGMFFTRGQNQLLQRIESRIARLLNWPLENGEGMQVLHYQPGAEYKPHYDYFDPAEPGTATILKRGGQRVATFLMYLNDPEKGGGTTFPDVHLEVAPKRGNAVFFSYDKPHPSTRSLHGGAPVIAGEKWIATKWLREREFI